MTHLLVFAITLLDHARKMTPYDLLEKIRRQQPVVHHLTNWVTIYDCAQIVKALGASPVMAHAPQEVEDMTQIASALVLNIGTLTVDFVEAMKLAANSANQRVIPVILDACGAGATRLRDRQCLELLDSVRIDIIKGNASEVARLAGETVLTKGVDAGEVGGNVTRLAQALARRRETIVVVTGEVDLVTDGKQTWRVKNGHPMMTRVVGTGCMAASVIGTFAAVEPDLAFAAASGLACYGIAAELAAAPSIGPAAFKARLVDCLYALDRATTEARLRVDRIEANA
jgi:hydroxyethylthiazole kinase